MNSKRKIAFFIIIVLAILLFGGLIVLGQFGLLGTFVGRVPEKVIEQAKSNFSASIEQANADRAELLSRVNSYQNGDTSFRRINTAVENGELNQPQADLMSLRAYFDSVNLPEKYSGTLDYSVDTQFSALQLDFPVSLLARLENNADQYSQAEQQEIIKMFPIPGGEFSECSEHYCAYSDNKHKRIVRTVLQEAENAWEQLSILGLATPLSDEFCSEVGRQQGQGADRPKTDIYIEEFPFPGLTRSCRDFGLSSAEQSKRPGYIHLDLEILTDVDESAAQFLVRHEVTHLSQNATNFFASELDWLIESMATYVAFYAMQPVIEFPAVEVGPRNDAEVIYQNMQAVYADNPGKSISSETTRPDSFNYALMFFWVMLDESHGQNNLIQLLNKTLEAGGSVPQFRAQFSGTEWDELLSRRDVSDICVRDRYSNPQDCVVGYRDGADYVFQPYDGHSARPPSMMIEGQTKQVDEYAVGGVIAYGDVLPDEHEKLVVRAKSSVPFNFNAYTISSNEGGSYEISQLPVANPGQSGFLELTLPEPPTGLTLEGVLLHGSNRSTTTSFFEYEFEILGCEEGNLDNPGQCEDPPGGGGRGEPPPGYGPFTDKQTCDNSGVCYVNHAAYPTCTPYHQGLEGATECKRDHYRPGGTFESCRNPVPLPPNPAERFSFWDHADYVPPTPPSNEGTYEFTPDYYDQPGCQVIVPTTYLEGTVPREPLSGVKFKLHYDDPEQSIFTESVTDEYGQSYDLRGMPTNEDLSLPAKYWLRFEEPQGYQCIPRSNQERVTIDGTDYCQILLHVNWFTGVPPTEPTDFSFKKL